MPQESATVDHERGDVGPDRGGTASEGDGQEAQTLEGDREPRWLTETQACGWRSFLKLHSLMFSAMNQDLQRRTSMSLSDYEVLVHLTDVEGDRRRANDLARSLDWEKSRLSKQVSRMEKRGLVAFEDVAEDRRGRWVVLTAKGREAIEEAAPGHVELVHSMMFDGLTPEQEATLATILPAVVDRIETEFRDD